MSDQQIQELIAVATDLVAVGKTTNERLLLVEHNSSQMSEAITKLTDNQSKLNESMVAMNLSSIESKHEMLRLEEKALGRIGNMNKAYSNISGKVDVLEHKVYTLELQKAADSSAKNTEDKLRGWFANNWFNFFKVIVSLCTVAGALIYLFKKVG